MKLSVLSNLFGSLSLEEVLTKFEAMGIDAVEIGCGGYPGKDHCDPKKLLADPKALAEFQDAFRRHNLEIAVLSCHGNAVHPDKEVAAKFHYDFERTCILANELEIPTVITFSGCPGDSENAKYPNWVTCP